MLGLDVAESTVSNYLHRLPRLPSQNWRPFVRNHIHQSVAVDFAVVPTRHTQYRLVASRTWSTLSAGSPTSTTRVAYAVLLDAPVPARVGSHTVTLGGRVGPQLAGVTVVKQRLRDGVWVDRGSQTVAADGTFGFVLRSRTARTVTYRVVAQPGVLDSGASLPVMVTFG